MTFVDAVSLYGVCNAGVRARLVGFLERVGEPYRLHSYFDGNAAGIREFARRPVTALGSELRLRTLVASSPDIVILSREASPLSSGDTEKRLLRSARHAVFDIDDALHHDMRGRSFEAFFSKGRKAATAVAVADVVIAGNDYLADWASQRARDVRVVPTCIDPSAYAIKSNYDVSAEPRLLWLGTPSGERYLRMIAPALRRLNSELGARLTVVGDATPRLGPLESMITRVEWTLARAARALTEHDIGIMPLADTAYERGKCAYKLLEYGAARLPAVASPVGVNGDIIDRAGMQRPVHSEDWYRSLHGICTAPPADRRSIATRLHDVVVREFSFSRWLPVWRAGVGL